MDFVPWFPSVRGNPTPNKERFYVGRDTIELERLWDRKSPQYKTDTILTYLDGEFYFTVSYGGHLHRFVSSEFHGADNSASLKATFAGTRAPSPYIQSTLSRFRELVAKSPEALRVMGLADYMRLTSMVERKNPTRMVGYQE